MPYHSIASTNVPLQDKIHHASVRREDPSNFGNEHLWTGAYLSRYTSAPLAIYTGRLLYPCSTHRVCAEGVFRTRNLDRNPCYQPHHMRQHHGARRLQRPCRNKGLKATPNQGAKDRRACAGSRDGPLGPQGVCCCRIRRLRSCSKTFAIGSE
ncbi:uncharacterized protein EI97DRAFT_258023 [Westerdykella ornata]|uniref:Uncharacterized protein n=1 Tax=Westerdykella ornata TaxID=318751 RepID=A0A6A6JQL7_WESOR|nr:uncharacterized protein EI97DRAFT_258023 [Westerdykella ornata]KAF2278555.1 hypothetical protein EI97DRAFT_258023 [Westerdykella ornata]